MSWDWEKLKEQQRQNSNNMPPGLDEFLNKINKFKIPGGPVIFFIIMTLFYLASNSIYQVGVDEVGIVQRFGEYVRKESPGLNIKWPELWPGSGFIEKVTMVKTQRLYKEAFGLSAALATDRNYYSSSNENKNIALMLTGDLNVAQVPWIVHYKIADPELFLFKVEDVKRLLRDMAEASMRMVVGDRSIDEVINKRKELADEAKIVLQAELSHAKTGIMIENIEMKKTNVPEQVQSSFNEVNQAIQEKEKMIYNAKKEYNQAIPAARGEAERTIKVAEGYAADRINRAKGDASRFISVYNEYNKAKDVTKRRLYLETLKDVFPRIGNKYIIDADQKNMLPLLNLGK